MKKRPVLSHDSKYKRCWNDTLEPQIFISPDCVQRLKMKFKDLMNYTNQSKLDI